VFAASCTGYCHGANGSAGSGAPALAARGFDADYIEKVVMYGVPGTAMIEWGQRIPKPDSAAVIAYVESLNGLTQAANATSLRDVSPEAYPGRDLFFDSDGALTGCSVCHQVSGKGIPVAPPITNVPTNVQALRNLATPRVSTATVDGRTFQAIVVTQVRGETKLYDLTVIPPVLLTLTPTAVKLSEHGPWQHSTALGTFTDEDLASILTFLRAVQKP
jgi:mono/diheme cytochrome c family protein